MKSKFILVILFLLLQQIQANQKQLNITFVSPHTSDNDFWGTAHNFARASADDLNINFKIIYNKNLSRFSYMKALKSAFIAKEKPDLVIAIFYKSKVIETLELSKKYNIPIFIVNSDIPKDEQTEQFLRKKYSTFIGHMVPDEQSAGYTLANYLIGKKRINSLSKKIEVVGISGHRESPTTVNRNNGLKKAAKENNITLHQIVYANWRPDIAYSQAVQLMQRYKNLDIIWAASDLMAINIKKAINKVGTNKDILVAGIDWTKDAMLQIKDGKLDASVGGHFGEIGFSLVLIHDYFYGKDFYNEFEGKINTQMSLLTSKNINRYYDFLTLQNWEKIDFKKYSKFLNPKVEQYDFTFDTLLKNYNTAK